MKKNMVKLKEPKVHLPMFPSMPDISCIDLNNNIPLYLFPSDSTDIIRLEITFNAGIINEERRLQSQFTSIMIPGGTNKLSAAEIDEAFDFLGSFPNFGATLDKAVVQLYILPRNFREAVSLLQNVIYEPVFPLSELQMQKETRLQKYLINSKKVGFVSRSHLIETIFGSGHPYGRMILPKHFASINQKDLQGFHSNFYKNGLSRIVISGYINDEIISITREAFGNATTTSNRSEPEPLPEVEPDGKKVFIEIPEALQNSIRLGRRTIKMNHPDYPALKIVDTLMGGYLGSRLMKNLREDKGYTYGINSSLSSLRLSGLLTISAEVGYQYTLNAINEIYREIDRICNEAVDDSELQIVRNSMLGDLVRQFDGPFATTESFINVLDLGVELEYYKRLAETIKTITPDEIKRVANTYYSIEGFHEIIAGRTK